MKLSRRAITLYQRVALVLSYRFHLLGKARRTPSISWVVGPDETATMLAQIARVIPNSYSVSFTEEAAYDVVYDHRFRSSPGRRWLERIVYGPVLLGKLMTQARGFIYVGATGFLLDDVDSREFEFAFVARHGLPIVCYWTGSDIRSTKLMHGQEAESGIPNISTYIHANGAIFETESWDARRRQIAEVADRHATVQYNWDTDQLGYLESGFETFMYFLPEDPELDAAKFDDLARPVIVHATTAPVIKGTPLVRAAIDKLRAEGYDFEYVELIGVSNARVMAELRRAHIVLNQFYGFTPTIFGVEAMLRQCAVLMSACTAVEPDLPAESDEAWFVTRHFEVYDNLKRVLDEPALLKPVAERGLAWAKKYATDTSAGAKLRETLDLVLEGRYSPPPRR